MSYETDEEFATALSSYDVPQVADALRRYLAFEVQSRCVHDSAWALVLHVYTVYVCLMYVLRYASCM